MSYDVLNYAEAADARNESRRCRWWTFPKQRSCEKHWLFIPAENRGKSATIPAIRWLRIFSNQCEQFSSVSGSTERACRMSFAVARSMCRNCGLAHTRASRSRCQRHRKRESQHGANQGQDAEQGDQNRHHTRRPVLAIRGNARAEPSRPAGPADRRESS